MLSYEQIFLGIVYSALLIFLGWMFNELHQCNKRIAAIDREIERLEA